MINFVVALACEAKPLIHALKLNAVSNHANIPLYANNTFRLIITGVGKLNAAIATTYLADRNQPEKNDVWLNVGVAGHRDAHIGTPIICHKITDGGSGLNWHPIFITPMAVENTAIITQEHAQTVYEPDTLYDMEAAGFYHAASRFNTTEFVHCLKIVSDNQDSPAKYLPEKAVSQLISTNLDTIERIALQLNEPAQQWQSINQAPVDMPKFLAQWHFTVYQQNRLRQLLGRWKTLFHDQPVWSQEIKALGHAKQVIHHIEQKIKQARMQFSLPDKTD